MNSMTMNPTREACTEEVCVHGFHDVDRNDPEDHAFHETDAIESTELELGRPVYSVRVTRFDNEGQWYVDAEVRGVLSAADALALADAIRLQAGVAYELSEGMEK